MRRGRAVFVALAIALAVAIAARGAAARSRERPGADPRIERLVANISKERLHERLTTLVGFGTRNTLSDPASGTRGIGAARQWIFDELTRSSPRLNVSFDTHPLAAQGRITRATELRNVIAVLPGRTARRIYVSAHYDSLNIGGTG